MSRRPTGRDRRFASRRVAAPAPFTPADDPLALLWWDPTTVSGAVTSWVDSIAGVSAAQATTGLKPTASATAIASTYPGVTSPDGARVLVAAGAGPVLVGKTTLTVVAAMVDSDTGVKVALELTTNTTITNGGMFLVVNDGGAGRLNASARGTTNMTERFVAETLATVKVVSVGYDFATAGDGAISFIRVNGVAQSLTTQVATSAAGSAANAALHLFGRGPGPLLGWIGTFGNIVFRNSIAQDSGLSALETYVGARVGITI